MKTIAHRLKEAREAAGLTQPELASRAGVSPGTIGNIEAGSRRNPRELLAIAAAVGVRPEWLRDGKGPRDALKGGDVLVWDKPEDLPLDPGRVWIDRWDYTCSAGDGGVQWEIRQKDALPFTEEFFKAIGSKPAHCKLLMVRGDSMEPLLFNRDMMMVDTSKTAIKDGGIYAVCFEDEPLVKQLFRQEGGALTLHSFNPKYPDRVISAAGMVSLSIIGALVYRSGSGFAGG